MATTGMPSFACGGGLGSDEKQQAEQPQKEYLSLKIDSPWELIPFIGRELSTLDIPQEAIKYIGKAPFLVYYDTSFLGNPCQSVTMSFRNEYSTKTDYVKSVSIYGKSVDFRKCKEYLDTELGECYDCGITPYAAVNGGAVTYYTYYKNGLCYKLSQGSAQSFYSLNISKGEPKGKPNRQLPVFGVGPGMNLMNSMVPTNAFQSAPKTQPVDNVDNREAWTCSSCGHTANKGKFCTECGSIRK